MRRFSSTRALNINFLGDNGISKPRYTSECDTRCTDCQYFGICAERLDEPWNNNDSPRLNYVIRAIRFDNLFRTRLYRTPPPPLSLPSHTVYTLINGRGLLIMKCLLADRRVNVDLLFDRHVENAFCRINCVFRYLRNCVTVTYDFSRMDKNSYADVCNTYYTISISEIICILAGHELL